MSTKEFTAPSLYDVPLDVDATREQTILHEVNPEKFREIHSTCPSSSLSVRSDGFIMLWEMMDTIIRGTDWKKKARIVLEYDPREKKMELITFQSEDETPMAEDQ